MGYKSEVALVVTVENYNALKSDLVCLEVLRYADTVTVSTDGVLVLWSDVKWYEDESPIKDFMTKLNSFDDGDYRLVELGESFDHVIEAGYWLDNPFNLQIQRRFEYDDSVGLDVDLNSDDAEQPS